MNKKNYLIFYHNNINIIFFHSR